MNNEKIDVDEAKEFIKKTCLNFTSQTVSMLKTKIRSYSSQHWDNLTNSAINFLNSCLRAIKYNKVLESKALFTIQ